MILGTILVGLYWLKGRVDAAGAEPATERPIIRDLFWMLIWLVTFLGLTFFELFAPEIGRQLSGA